MPSIRVVARYRPINKSEKKVMQIEGWDTDYVVPFMIQDPNDDLEYKKATEFDGYPRDTSLTTVMVMSTGSVQTNPKFTFDRILWWDTDQEYAFEAIGKPACTDFVTGLNMTIFAYGQSGSGKSFTTFGQEPTHERPKPDPHLMGIIPRSIDFVFAWLTSKKSSKEVEKCETELRVYEIYIHNQIKDLLFPAKPGDKKLRIRDGPNRTFVEGLKGAPVNSVEDVLRQTIVAQANRTVTCTGLNAVSSRSHCIFEFLLKYTTSDRRTISAKMNFADLAGSEKVGKTGASGLALKEAQAINGSLTVLGRCIAELVKGARNPPFRETALAHCLKTSLSGNCKTTLIVAASPHRYNMTETISSFQFAARAKMIKTKAKKNTTMSPAQMRREIKRLKGENKELKMKLLKGGHKGATVTGPEIKVIWDEAVPIPEEEKERKKAVKDYQSYCTEMLESNHIDDINVNVEILEKPPYTAVITLLADDQNDVEACRKFRDVLFDNLKTDTSGPFSKRKSMEKADPLSPEVFEELKAQLNESIEEAKTIKADENKWKQEIIELTNQLEEAQKNLQVKQTELDKHKKTRGHNLWKNLLDKRRESQRNLKKSDFNVDRAISIDVQTDNVEVPTDGDKASGQGFLIDRSAMRKTLLSGSGDQDLTRAQTEINYEKPKKGKELRFLDDARNLRKSVIEDVEKQRKRQEEHEKLMDQMYKQQEGILRRTKMIEASKDDPTMINNLLEMMKQQADETEEVTGKMQEYFDEAEELRKQSMKMSAENDHLHDAIDMKENQLMELRATISNLEDQLKGVEAYEHVTQRTMDTLRIATDRSIADAADVLRRSRRSSKVPSIEASKPGGGGGRDSKSLWGLLRKKIDEKKEKQELTMAQNAANQMHSLVQGIVKQREYLRETTTRYMKDMEMDEKQGHNMFQSNVFLDEFAEKDVVDWSVDDVCEWLGTVESGALEKFVQRFRKRNVNGELLCALKKRELQKEYRMKKDEVELFFNELTKLTDYDDDSVYGDYDNPEDLATSMLESELVQMQNVVMPEVITEKVWSFVQLRENFPDMPKVLLVKVFSLLEKEQSGVINLEELGRFLEACREEPGMEPGEVCDLYNDMDDILRQFVDYKTVFKNHAPHSGINIHGAKKIIKKLRDCKGDEIRDNDLGVEFILELKYKEFQNLLRRCPNNTWTRLANFDPFELLYQEVKKTGASRVIFRKYVEAFIAIGMPYGQGDIKRFFEKMGLSTTRPTPYVNTFARLVLYNLVPGDDEKDENEEEVHEVLQFIEDVMRFAEWKRDDDDDDVRSISTEAEQSLLEQKSQLGYPGMGGLHPQVTVPGTPSADMRPSPSGRGPGTYMGMGLSVPMPSPMGGGMMHGGMMQGGMMQRGMMQGGMMQGGIIQGGMMQRGVETPYRVNNISQPMPMPITQIGPQMPLPSTQIKLTNQKLNAVRQRLMRFAVFGTANKRGFEGINDLAFKFSTSIESENPARACRLNATQAKGPSAWVADVESPNSDNTHHVITTLGTLPMDLYAVAMQGRGDADEWVTQATILVSVDGANWKNLPTVHRFSCDDRDSVVIYPLYTPARCKYVKLRVDKWHNAPALRWDCLAV
jgi:hypothetical protein